jgi:hypothetical protein
VDHVATIGQTAQVEAAKGGSVAGSHAAAGLEESLWLCPIEDRRGLDSTHEGMVQGFSLGSYVKAHVSQQFEPGPRNSSRRGTKSG